MGRNKLAGKGRVYKKRGMTKAAIERKRKYDSQYQKKRSAVKKRVEANKANRRAGTYGNGDGKDASHKKGGKIVMESQSKNRARNGMKKGRKPSAKRKNTRKK
jgi:hypothetical protein